MDTMELGHLLFWRLLCVVANKFAGNGTMSFTIQSIDKGSVKALMSDLFTYGVL
jgi:hypothetical protein